MSDNTVHIISLGAGVQSSTMALMAAMGEITPMPSCAIFADTQAEPKSVYTWLDWLEKQLPFPVRRVTAGNLAEVSTTPKLSSRSGELYLPWSVPVYTINEDGSKGTMFRQCTDKSKLTPLYKAIDVERGDRDAVVWIGISVDEASRIKPSRKKQITNAWPLIEKGISRMSCLQWMKNKNYPSPPRSACSFCPYHSDSEWIRLKRDEPEAFQQAIQYEKKLQESFRLIPRLTSLPFLHPRRNPIDKIDFEPTRDIQSDFNNECEGMCGV